MKPYAELVLAGIAASSSGDALERVARRLRRSGHVSEKSCLEVDRLVCQIRTLERFVRGRVADEAAELGVEPPQPLPGVGSNHEIE